MNIMLDMPSSLAWMEPGDRISNINRLKRALTATIQKFSPSGSPGNTKLCLLEDAKVVVDGVTHSGWRFRTGLFYRIQGSAPAFGLAINVVRDLRPTQWPAEKLAGLNMDLSLRPYQQELVIKMLQHDMGVMEAATGAGKTRMAAAMIAYTKAPTLFLVHTKDLLEQARASLSALLQTKVGVVGDGIRDIQPVTVGMVQTMVNMDSDYTVVPQGYWDMVIVDETHHLPADTFYTVTSKFKARRIYGLSATSYRKDGGDLLIEAGAGPIVAKIGASALIKDGVLVRPFCRFIQMSGQTSYAPMQPWQVYKKFIVKNEMRNTVFAQFAHDFSVNRGWSVVLYVRHIEHAREFEELLKASQTPYIVLDGKDSSETRQRVLQQLRNKEIKLVISTLFNEGVDVPSLDCMLNAAGGSDTIQLVGRVLRASPGKTVATIIDALDTGHVTLQKSSIARFRRLQEEPEFVVTVG